MYMAKVFVFFDWSSFMINTYYELFRVSNLYKRHKSMICQVNNHWEQNIFKNVYNNEDTLYIDIFRFKILISYPIYYIGAFYLPYTPILFECNEIKPFQIRFCDDWFLKEGVRKIL